MLRSGNYLFWLQLGPRLSKSFCSGSICYVNVLYFWAAWSPRQALAPLNAWHQRQIQWEHQSSSQDINVRLECERRLKHESRSTRTHFCHVKPQHAGPTAGFNSMAGASLKPFALVLFQNHSSSKYTRSWPPDTTSHTTQSLLWRSWYWNPGPQPCTPVNNIELPSFLFYLKDSHHVSAGKVYKKIQSHAHLEPNRVLFVVDVSHEGLRHLSNPRGWMNDVITIIRGSFWDIRSWRRFL